jgi:hypothetical protein
MEQIKYTTALPLNYSENVLLENNIIHYSWYDT